jgi:hypothetical protein
MSLKIVKQFKKKSKKGGSSQNCVFNIEKQIMEGKCPGLKYLNELSVPITQNSDSLYMMFGHGCDLEREVLRVPEGCEYYTVTACGMSVEANPKLNKDFFNNTLDLTKSEIYTYYAEPIADSKYPLIQYSGEQKLYKRKSGESYVNNIAFPFNGLGNYSGLRKMGSIISNNIPIDSGYLEPNFITRNSEMNFSKDIYRPYTLELYYLQHYAGSIFPKTSQVCKLLHENYTENELNSFNYSLYNGHTKFEHLIDKNFRIDYASIMKVFKGRFINASCRPICRDPNLTKSEVIPVDPFVALRRRISADLPLEWNEYEQEQIIDE